MCGGRLKKKDWVERIAKKIGGDEEWMLIERRKCTNESCRKTHRLLPDISIPYKQYEAGAIEDVIDGTLDEEALSEIAIIICEELYLLDSLNALGYTFKTHFLSHSDDVFKQEFDD